VLALVVARFFTYVAVIIGANGIARIVARPKCVGNSSSRRGKSTRVVTKVAVTIAIINGIFVFGSASA